MKVELVEVALVFRRPVHTAAGAVDARRSILLSLSGDGHTGWGEAASFPSGMGGDPEEAWRSLTGWCDDPSSLPEVPIARAAVEEARMDLAARAAGLALHERLGGGSHSVPARHALGITEDLDGLVKAVGELHDQGIRYLKLKISPDSDVEPVRAVAGDFPDIDIALDANGSYRDPSDPALAALADLGVSSIEQPFPAGDLVSHKVLRERLAVRVCLDESVRTVETAAMALTAGASDMISVKLGRHGWSDAVVILEQAREAGVAVKAGGTFDTAVGRRHLLALATLPGVEDAEAAPPIGYLSTDVGGYPQPVEGRVAPTAGPGIAMVPEIPGEAVLRRHRSEI